MFGRGGSGTSPFEQPRLRFDFFKNKPSNAAVLLPLFLLSLLLVIVGYMLNMPQMIKACCSMDHARAVFNHVARRARVSVCIYVCSLFPSMSLIVLLFLFLLLPSWFVKNITLRLSHDLSYEGL